MRRTIIALSLLALCAAFPAVPWNQKGHAFVQELEIDVEVARKVVPQKFAIVETKPGSGITMGSLYLAHYTNSSTVEYNEMFFIIATVRYTVGGATGSWIANCFVDSKDAQEAGIGVWGIPKQLAQFSWSTQGELSDIKVTQNGATVIAVNFTDVRIKIPMPSATQKSFGIFSNGQVLASSTKQTYSVGLIKQASVRVPSSSPLASMWPTDSSRLTTKVTMGSGTFDMTPPEKLASPAISRASRMFETTPESSMTTLQVVGTIPGWLQGQLIRNSPGTYENGNDQMRHWNDGWAQLHGYHIDGATNSVNHHSKNINSSSWHKASTTNSISETGYGTPSNPGPRPYNAIPKPNYKADGFVDSTTEDGLGGILNGFATNPMVNIWKFDDKMMATTDENLFIEFNNDTLETIGGVNTAWDPNDAITKKGEMGIGVAHGRYDRYTKEHFWLEIDLAKGPIPANYNFWKYTEKGGVSGKYLTGREIVGTVQDSKSSFVHSIAMTKKYILLIQCPMHYEFLKFLTAKQIIDTIKWDPDTPVKWHVMDRQTGSLVKSATSSSAFFVYHILNAYDDSNGDIVTHFSMYQNDTLITYGMYLENIVNNPKEYVPTYAQAVLTRCTVFMSSDRAPECNVLNNKTFEMATFNWYDKHMEQAQYAWGATIDDPNTPWHDGASDFIDKQIKLDLSSGEVLSSWSQPGAFCSEPLFAPHPNPKSEDDGILMSVWYDSIADHSFLVMLDGITMKEVARANMAGRLAASFHGKWCPTGENVCIGL